MQIFIVMCNDDPFRAYKDSKKAEECKDRLRSIKPSYSPRNYYHVREIELFE